MVAMDAARTTAATRILIADDHPAMREGLRAAFHREPDIDVVGEATDGAECLRLHGELAPDITLLDLQMPGTDGMTALAQLREREPAAVVIVLSTFEGEGRVTRALTAGASAYLLKSAPLEDIVDAVRRLASGGTAAATTRAPEGEPLAPREIQVLRHVAQGMGNREIAEVLYVSEDAVKSRMKRILEKLGAHDRAHAVRLGIERGYIDV
jgi:Response regulator containing a CheY-like receiver domain and an HTH DNA-binding domain